MTTIVAPPWEEQPTGGGIPDAPSDGKTYGRKNATWAEVTSGGSSGAATVLWADRPAASATPGGEIIVSDLGYQKMFSDGTNWRPIGGRLRLRSQRGLVAAPIATITGLGLFAIPGGAVVIPAGLLTVDASVTLHADSVVTSSTSGVLSLFGYIGTVNAGAGSSILCASPSFSGTAAHLAMSGCVKFKSATSGTTRMYAGCGQSASGTGAAEPISITDITTKIDTALPMFVNVGTSSMAGAVSNLITFDVFVEM